MKSYDIKSEDPITMNPPTDKSKAAFNQDIACQVSVWLVRIQSHNLYQKKFVANALIKPCILQIAMSFLSPLFKLRKTFYFLTGRFNIISCWKIRLTAVLLTTENLLSKRGQPPCLCLLHCCLYTVLTVIVALGHRSDLHV